MEPFQYPDFHVKNDRFLFPLDLPILYSKFYGTAYLQDLFHSIFYFVVFYIYSSFFFPSQMSYIIYLDGAAIDFLLSRTLSILSFLHCCLFQLTPIFFFPLSIHYLYYPDCAAIDFLISNTIHSIFSFVVFYIDTSFFFPSQTSYII